MDIMLEKRKVFVRGSIETKKVLEEIKEKLHIIVNDFDQLENSNYMFGPSPEYSAIWYARVDETPNFFIRRGCKEVTPREFREAWLGEESPKQESKPKDFCCKGCEKLREVCQRLAKERFVNPSETNFKSTLSERFYFFEMEHTICYYNNGNLTRGELVSPEEFYERIAGKPWEEKKKYLGFVGDSNICTEILPIKIKNPKRLKGTDPTCIYYIKDNELTYCMIGTESKDISFKLVSYSSFLADLYGKSDSEHPLTPEDCSESKQKTKEINFVQSFVKNPSENLLCLSEQKPLKIIL